MQMEHSKFRFTLTLHFTALPPQQPLLGRCSARSRAQCSLQTSNPTTRQPTLHSARCNRMRLLFCITALNAAEQHATGAVVPPITSAVKCQAAHCCRCLHPGPAYLLCPPLLQSVYVVSYNDRLGRAVVTLLQSVSVISYINKDRFGRAGVPPLLQSVSAVSSYKDRFVHGSAFNLHISHTRC